MAQRAVSQYITWLYIPVSGWLNHDPRHYSPTISPSWPSRKAFLTLTRKKMLGSMWMGLGKSKQVFPWCLPTGLGGIYKLSHPNLVNILDSAGQNANKTRWPSIFCPHWYRKFIGLVQRIMDNLQKPPIFHGGKPHFHVDVISERVLRWKKEPPYWGRHWSSWSLYLVSISCGKWTTCYPGTLTKTKDGK